MNNDPTPDIGQKTWTDPVRLHFEDIGIQHQRLAGLMEALDLAVSTARNAAVDRQMEDLIQLVQLNFSSEEQFMLEQGYPDRKRHEIRHLRFLEWCMDLQCCGSDGRGRLTSESCDEIRVWLRNHDAADDRRCRDYYAPVALEG